MLKATLLMAMMHVRTDIFLLFYKNKKCIIIIIIKIKIIIKINKNKIK